MNCIPGGGRGLVGQRVGDDPGLLAGVVHESHGGALAVEVDDGEDALGEAGRGDALGSNSIDFPKLSLRNILGFTSQHVSYFFVFFQRWSFSERFAMK